MLSKIIHFSIKNKLIIGLLVFGLIGFGTYQVGKLPIDAVPDITDNQVQVITTAPSFGATDIERLVTYPIEQANSNIAGIKEIRSFSRFGLSLVTIVFDDETDVYWARQQVAERLQQVQSQIPAGIGTPELGPVSTGLGEIYQYIVKPKPGFEHQYDAIKLRTIQDWIVRRQLLGVKGVAEVSSFGGKLKQYEIAINPDKLNAAGITITDVFDALESNNQNTGGAYIEKGPTVLYIRTEGLLAGIEDIQNVAIHRKNGANSIFIRDIAEVKIGFATRYGALCLNDEGEVTGAIVMMLKGANSSEVIKSVKERIAQIQKTLPEGVEIEPFLDRSKMVNNAIRSVSKNLLEGALIVIFILVLFLGNLRAGLLVASVIPLSMLFAVCMMNAFGVSGNLMSLGALDFGLIVDGAVIIVEAVIHNLAFKKFDNTLTQSDMDEEVNHSASKMMNSAVFGQIIILIVYLPIFTLQGIEGKMFKPMAQTVAFALLGAFILSLTYIPMMSAWVLSKKTNHQPNFSDKIMLKVEIFYQSALTKTLDFSKLILASVVMLFIASVFIMTRLGGEFIPALEEGDFAVETRILTGSNLNTSIEYTQKAAHILKSKFPEVEKVVTKIGSGEVPTDPMPMEASDMMVILKDKSEWTSAETFDELAEKMSIALQDVPGITAGFQYPVQMRFNELMTGAKQDVVCKIFGENLDTLSVYAEKLGKIVNEVRGSENLFVEPITGMPQLIISYNRPMIAQYDVSIAEINKVVNTAFAGQSAGLIFEEEKRFDLVVRLDATERKSLEDVQNLLIPTPNGSQIALSTLAKVEIKEGPNQIQREDAKRRIVVGFNVGDRDVQSIVQDLQAKVDAKLKLPAGYYVSYGGSFENLEKAKNRLLIAVPVSLLLIFVLLFFAFNSIKQGLLIYSAIPLSAIGGILFLALRGMPFSISAAVGFIALFGVAVLNGIVLIAEFNQIKTEGETDIKQIVLKGTKNRLRPVLMTAFVASLGFLPMALSNGAGAEVQRPLATVVIGGLLIATFLTLFVLPLLYILFENKNTMKSTSIIVLLLFFNNFKTQAQSTITLKNAIEMASQNNLILKQSRLETAHSEAMIKTNKDIAKTGINTELGQFNSFLIDTKIGINQTLALPKVYQSQKSVLTENFKTKQENESLQKYAIDKAITSIFYEFDYLKSKEKLILKTDSLYAQLLKNASIQIEKGEGNQLEKTILMSQKANVELEFKQIQQEINAKIIELQNLLNSPNQLIPLFDKNDFVLSFNPTIFENHPQLKRLLQAKNAAIAQTDFEKTKMLPDLNFGYNNFSIRGIAANERFYKSINRFHTVQLGVNIPLYTKNLKQQVEVSKLNENLIENERRLTNKILENKYQQLATAYQNKEETVIYYEKSGLNVAAYILAAANKQLDAGEINYSEFATFARQAIDLEKNYIEAKKELNKIILDINYL